MTEDYDMKKYSVILLNLLTVIFGACGLGFTIFGDGFMNSGTFLYYTVQSNILAMLTSMVLIVFEWHSLKGYEVPNAVQFFRLLSAVAITLTFLVFSLMLTPQMIIEGNGAYLRSPGNIFVHNLVPVCAILDWCLFGSAAKLRKVDSLCGMVPAFAYVCFAYICVARGIRFSDNVFPYFFLDYKTYGWFRIGNGGIGVIYWIIILAVVLYGLGRVFTSIANRREKNRGIR